MLWDAEFIAPQHIPQFAAEGCARYFTGGRYHQRLSVEYTTCWQVSDRSWSHLCARSFDYERYASHIT